MLQHHKATETEKRLLCTWKYDGEYALYDMPSYEEMQARQFGLANPRMYVETFFDGPTLVGFCNLFDDGDEVFFGIGVNPQCCGQGCRAIRCYQKAGFTIDGDVIHQKTNAGEGGFYRMVRR